MGSPASMDFDVPKAPPPEPTQRQIDRTISALATNEVLAEIAIERDKQESKFGPQNHSPANWLMILGEEVGEANKAALEHHFASHKGIKGRESLSGYRKELIQVAAVAVAMVESLDRNEMTNG